MIAVALTLDDNPEIREEDYAAAWMGIQNLSLGAAALGYGSHVKTGAVMDDPRARGPRSGSQRGSGWWRRSTSGVPAATPEPKERVAAAERTVWVE